MNTGLLTRATLAGRYCVSAIVSAYAASLHRENDSYDLARAS